jgi:tRNA modification GTPase
MLNDPIAAISTPVGIGALAVVRMSGEGCLEIIDRLYKGENSPLNIKKRGILIGRIYGSKSEVEIDEVVVSIFRGPGSYTGEDMVEITCHGGRYIPIAILEECLREGARMAEGGEFTRRAYLNGKLDLIQAEAVCGMIQATTKRAHRLAVDQLEKLLSLEISTLREEIKALATLLEYEIDFPGEEEFDAAGTKEKAAEIRLRIKSLLETWKEGSISTEGAVVVIAGLPNVGKSSLFNLMAKRARAIVTPHPGTTRDAIEQEISLSGLLVRLVDTAGLRETEDDVERIGVEVSRNYLSGADIVLFLVDTERGVRQEDRTFLKEMKDKDVIVVMNKVDRVKKRSEDKVQGRKPVYLSTKTGEGFEELKEKILVTALGGAERSGPAITTMRQKTGIEDALAGLDRMLDGIGNDLSAEYLVEDLRTSVRALGELIGAIPTEEILEEIFSRFCVGK